jgi:hypothetical protein
MQSPAPAPSSTPSIPPDHERIIFRRGEQVFTRDVPLPRIIEREEAVPENKAGPPPPPGIWHVQQPKPRPPPPPVPSAAATGVPAPPSSEITDEEMRAMAEGRPFANVLLVPPGSAAPPSRPSRPSSGSSATEPPRAKARSSAYRAYSPAPGAMDTAPPFLDLQLTEVEQRWRNRGWQQWHRRQDGTWTRLW